MIVRQGSFILIFCVIISIACVSASPDASPTTTNELAEPSTPITTCQELNQPGTYILQNDIDESSFLPEGCFLITAPEVTLDCADHQIKSATLALPAVYSNQEGTTITNCEISMSTSGSYAIRLVDATNAVIEQNVIASTKFPLSLEQTTGAQIRKNIIKESTRGIALTSSANNLFEANEFINQVYAFFLYESSGNTITGTTINGCTSPTGCIMVRLSSHNIFEDLAIENALTSAVYIDSESSSHNRFENTRITGSGEYDIEILGTGNYNNTFIDSYYDSTKEFVAETNELVRAWYFQAFIKNDQNSTLANVALHATESQEFNRSFNLMTERTGLTPVQEATHYVNNGTRHDVEYAIQVIGDGMTSITETRMITENTYPLYTLSTLLPEEQPEEETGRCRSDWTCSVWSSCEEGIQTRSCELTLSYCLPQTSKPSESQTCSSIITLAAPTSPPAEAEQNSFAPITGAVTGVGKMVRSSLGLAILAIIVIAGYILVGMKRKAK